MTTLSPGLRSRSPAALANTPVRGQSDAWQTLVNVVAATFVFFGMMSLIEPSPYDFLSLLTIGLWFIGGVRINTFLVWIVLAWTLREISQFIALIPHWDEPDPVMFQMQSFYLYVTVVFFTLFFAEHTKKRMTWVLNGYTFGCVVSSAIAILSYLGLPGFAELTTIEGRVSGTFKDPNVFGSYIPLGACWLLYNLLVGRSRVPLLSLLSFGLILAGVFLSFSRGSWGAAVVALIMVAVGAFATSRDPATRRRVFFLTIFVGACAAVGLMIILSIDSIRDFFLDRFTLAKDYDSGETGRFGNQLRSIPMLFERPLGFGPLRYRLIFDLDPHNSYVGAFANGGWLGGALWLTIVGATLYVGFRLMFRPNPFRPFALAVTPAIFVLLLQGFQIDIDHWRQCFLLFGMNWGMEAARRRQEAERETGRAPAIAKA